MTWGEEEASRWWRVHHPPQALASDAINSRCPLAVTREGEVLCLAQVVFVKTLARLVFVLSVSGAVPQPFTHANGADAGGLRATHSPVALALIRALRPTEG
jgi:hypothetical protein